MSVTSESLQATQTQAELLAAETLRLQHTVEDFMRGVPERIVEATDPRILILWPHGDETLGARVAHHINSRRPELWQYVDYVCGNPIAASQEPAVRDTSKFEAPVADTEVVGTDMNRSYAPKESSKLLSYEEQRAEMIKALIRERGYDYVLDMHTSKSNVDRCLIVSERYWQGPASQEMIRASRVGKIAVLPEVVPDNENPGQTRSLVTLGLIGQVAQAISIEYHRPVALEVGVQETMAMIDNLLLNDRAPLTRDAPRDVYYVERTVPKGADFSTIENFHWHEDGYFPVLVSQENDYGNDPTKDYSGFAASRREIVRI